MLNRQAQKLLVGLAVIAGLIVATCSLLFAVAGTVAWVQAAQRSAKVRPEFKTPPPPTPDPWSIQFPRIKSKADQCK